MCSCTNMCTDTHTLFLIGTFCVPPCNNLHKRAHTRIRTDREKKKSRKNNKYSPHDPSAVLRLPSVATSSSAHRRA